MARRAPGSRGCVKAQSFRASGETLPSQTTGSKQGAFAARAKLVSLA
jgi:hypothetical protein